MSSVAGLQAAGIVEAFHFDPVTGLVGVSYTSAWLAILREDLALLPDPAYVAAVLIDDPVAVRMWVERTAPPQLKEASADPALGAATARPRKRSR